MYSAASVVVLSQLQTVQAQVIRLGSLSDVQGAGKTDILQPSTAAFQASGCFFSNASELSLF
jgi:hypothetical protein